MAVIRDSSNHNQHHLLLLQVITENIIYIINIPNLKLYLSVKHFVTAC